MKILIINCIASFKAFVHTCNDDGDEIILIGLDSAGGTVCEPIEAQISKVHEQLVVMEATKCYADISHEKPQYGQYKNKLTKPNKHPNKFVYKNPVLRKSSKR